MGHDALLRRPLLTPDVSHDQAWGVPATSRPFLEGDGGGEQAGRVAAAGQEAAELDGVE